MSLCNLLMKKWILYVKFDRRIEEMSPSELINLIILLVLLPISVYLLFYESTVNNRKNKFYKENLSIRNKDINIKSFESNILDNEGQNYFDIFNDDSLYKDLHKVFMKMEGGLLKGFVGSYKTLIDL